MYKVLVRFADLQDNDRIYEAGEVFPRLGLTVSDERLAELADSDNRAGRPLIAKTDEPAAANEHNAAPRKKKVRKDAG